MRDICATDDPQNNGRRSQRQRQTSSLAEDNLCVDGHLNDTESTTWPSGSEEGEGQTQLGCEGEQDLVEDKQGQTQLDCEGQTQLDCEEEQIAGLVVSWRDSWME